jgi:hypothetical protein
MKKHFLTPLTALLLLAVGLLVCGCEKEPPPPPPVVDSELVPTLELSVTPEGVIPYGEGSVVINFQTKDANQVLVNGVRKPSVKLGTHTIKEKLFKDTTLVVKAINIKKMVEKSVTIQVGDWTTSTFGLVSYYPWRKDSLGVSSLDGKILRRWSVTPVEKDVVYYYLKEGILYSSENPNRTNPWYILDENTIVINGSVRKLQVDDKQMIISYQTEDHGEIVWFDMIFKHASDVPNDPV